MGIDQLSGGRDTLDRIQAGQEFVSADRVSGVAGGSTAFDLVIQNPTGSGIKAFVGVDIRPGGLAQLNVSDNVTIDTAGTAASEQSLNLRRAEAGTLNIETGGSYTVNGTTQNSVVPGGSGPKGGGGTLPSSVTWELTEGDSVKYEVINRSGQSSDFGYLVRWFER